MVKVTVEGPQGSGKTQIAFNIMMALGGLRLPYSNKHLSVELFDDENLKTPKPKKNTDVVIYTKQTKGAK